MALFLATRNKHKTQGLRRPIVIACLIPLLVLSGCHLSPSKENLSTIYERPFQHINNAFFEHRIWSNSSTNSQRAHSPLNIYIHGDGLPWRSKNRISTNPTPTYSLTWALMQNDPYNSIFISRPCYFGTLDTDTACNPLYWTMSRYSGHVVKSLTKVIQEEIGRRIKQQPLNTINLIGFSGGGTLATLIAAELTSQDIHVRLVTVAANLDIDSWTEYHDYSLLSESINPSTLPRLTIPQWHFCGNADRVIPAHIGAAFFQKQHVECTVVEATHEHGWLEQWPTLLDQIVDEGKALSVITETP